MNKRNYQRELDQLLEHTQKEEKVPRLFLHSCCAPCSSYVLEYLSQYFEITVFFYNPNISLEEEYRKRVAEIQRLVAEMSFTHPVHILEGTYDPQIFYEMARGLEKIPEGGERCLKCYRLRTVINVLLSCHTNMAFIGRIIADVFFQSVSGEKNKTKTNFRGLGFLIFHWNVVNW